MKRYIALILPILVILARPTAARVSIVDVTQETQKQQNLQFHLFAFKVTDKLFNVRFNAPREGKLKETHGGTLEVRDDKQLILSVPLLETTQPGDTDISFNFAISRELLNKGALHLSCGEGTAMMDYVIHLSTFVQPAH